MNAPTFKSSEISLKINMIKKPATIGRKMLTTPKAVKFRPSCPMERLQVKYIKAVKKPHRVIIKPNDSPLVWMKWEATGVATNVS